MHTDLILHPPPPPVLNVDKFNGGGERSMKLQYYTQSLYIATPCQNKVHSRCTYMYYHILLERTLGYYYFMASIRAAFRMRHALTGAIDFLLSVASAQRAVTISFSTVCGATSIQ